MLLCDDILHPLFYINTLDCYSFFVTWKCMLLNIYFSRTRDK